VFTEKSFEEIERVHDKFIVEKIKEHYEAHPEERSALIDNSSKEKEAESSSE
jgi:hypothetical protein